MTSDQTSKRQELDDRLRQLEASKGRDSDEFRELSAERERLLNAADDAAAADAADDADEH